MQTLVRLTVQCWAFMQTKQSLLKTKQALLKPDEQ
jgi:hypothetical protein